MKKKKITITLAKDIDVTEAVSKALNQNNKKNHIAIKASKQQENGIQEGKLASCIYWRI